MVALVVVMVLVILDSLMSIKLLFILFVVRMTCRAECPYILFHVKQYKLELRNERKSE